ncbi:SNF2 family DNA/RNA helicase [Planococcus donghaensis MPA1U2]|uniref:SNF2 family DNA/RNA helicase n=1 Tax=Planococcus donghaensis MPA1U2 TaxID=933115 RepID=E7RCM3_9BACL|nr:SNF2-related protein [Planococcus donghaensis]EGA91388.1 SNF2 family DNA/RNA helicase [Planococcus donghaensis MPA1U2]
MYKTLNLKPSYYTTTSNVLKEFYEPVLTETVKYDRVSGYFSSKALAVYSKGLEGLVRNNGRYRLIISEDISEEDFEMIKGGYDLRDKFTRGLIEKMEAELSVDEEMKLNNLAYLISNGYVDIKIGFKRGGLFHSKFGICEDSDGNVLYFTGSNNETQAAIKHNFESFDVTTSWLSSDFDQQKISQAKNQFEKLWNDEVQEMNIYIKDINEIIKRRIMSYDKGRLILDIAMLQEDSLVLTMEDNRLLLHDNLTSYDINPKDFVIAKKLVKYYDGGFPNFREDLTYIEIQNIISILDKYANKKGFSFVVSERLSKFIDQQAYWIEERSQYGLLIKNRNPKIINDFKKFETIVSRELYRPLREQQMWSAFYMHQMEKSANFSVPGSGKTSMIYGVFAYLNAPEIDKIDKIVMIGPKNAFLSWKLEFDENFGGKKDLKVLDIHQEEGAEVQIRINSGDKNVILINYESLAKYESALQNILDERTMLVFDEVHKVKGIQSKRAQVAKRISEKPRYKFVLTGTPIPNSYQDIYNFLNILYAEEYKMFFDFQINALKNPNQSEVIQINEKLYPFFWRTNKKQLQVPQINPDEVIKVPATEDEQAIIDLLFEKYGYSPFVLYIRLIQAATNPELLLKAIDTIEMYGEEEVKVSDWYNNFISEPVAFSEEEVSLIRQNPTTSKYQAAINLAEELIGESKQTIIWCIFVNTIDKVYRDLSALGIKAAVIYGSTPQEERDAIIGMFKNNEIEVLITNPHTLAESVSLHKTCHDAIYLEYSFNLTHMLQSRDRIHRLGLPSNQYTQYYYFMLEGQEEKRNTIDEKIYIRLKEKEERMLEAIEGDVLTPEPTDDMDDILSLFKL